MAKKATVSGPSMAEHKQWEAQDDLRTLERAAQIQQSAARLRAARAEAKRQMDALGKVAGPKKKAAPKKRAAAKKTTPRRTRARKRS